MWPSYKLTTAGIVTAVVAVVIVTWGTVGVGVASGQSADVYGVRQGGECYEVTPLTGDESVKQFYGYHTTIDDDPSAVGVSPSFSSEGTFDLQRAETSLLFLYKAPNRKPSLVMIHGARQEGEDGGAASFNVTGLPAEGAWVVKDDDYDSPNNTDRWSHGGTTAEIDWAWSKSATDGGAFAGLGDDFEIAVDPAFNGEAELFGVDNWGVVDDWQFLTGNRSDPERVPLDMEENVTISTAPCDGEAGPTETETETETEAGAATETEAVNANDDDADDRGERADRDAVADEPNRGDDRRGNRPDDDEHPIFDNDDHPAFDDDEGDGGDDEGEEEADEEDDGDDEEDEEDEDEEDEEDDD